MIERFSPAVWVLATVLFTGCGDSTKTDVSKERLEQMSGGTLKPTVPVSGIVKVDGNPQGGVELQVYSTTDGTIVTSVRTGEIGEYCLSTYTNCDGIPAGTYRLAFSYIPKQKKNDDGVDLFKGRYKNPIKNKFPLIVADGVAQTNVDFDLKSK